MIKKIIIFIAIFLFSVTLLTLFNYRRTQNQLRERKETRLTITLGGVPSEVSLNSPVNFKWEVSGPPDFSAKTTGIYWGYDSTPSAVTKFDSPKALNYPDFTPDYATGRFPLPQNFDANIIFSKIGTAYYRAYALVGEDHLWSEERQLSVK